MGTVSLGTTGSKSQAETQVVRSVAALADLLSARRGEGAWWSPHSWKDGRRLSENWLGAEAVVIDVDAHDPDGTKRRLSREDQAEIGRAWTEGELPGHACHLTPHGLRLVCLLAKWVNDPVVWTETARGLCDAVDAALSITDMKVDRPTTLDRARLFWCPNAAVEGEQRASKILTIRNRAPYAPVEAPKPPKDAQPQPRPKAGAPRPSGRRGGAWAKARDAYVDQHPLVIDERRTCPACGHRECVNTLPHDPTRLWCWSTNHGDIGKPYADDISGEIRGMMFDALDIAASQNGCDATKVLVDAGLLPKPRPKPEGVDLIEAWGEHVRESGEYVREAKDWADEILDHAAQDDGCDLFRRGDHVMMPIGGALVPVNATSMIGIASKYVEHYHWRTTKKSGEARRPKAMRRNDGLILIEHGSQSETLPEVRAISNHPTFHMNGHGVEIVQEGYNPDSRTYLTKGSYIEPEDPGDLSVLKQDIIRLVEDFPFTSVSDLHNWVALAYTLILRPALPIVPLFYVGASLPGTGKSLLVSDVTSRLICGEAVPTMQIARDEEETRKRVEAAVYSGQSIVLFDNVPTDQLVSSGTLAQMLTSEKAAMRVLGSTNHTTMDQSSMFVVTGNNVTFSEELSSRAVLVSLSPTSPRPTQRDDFKHPDLRAWVNENRLTLLPRMLGAVRAYADAGMPLPTQAPKFRMIDWRMLVVGLCEWIGFDRVLANTDDMESEHGDSFQHEVRRMANAWIEHNGGSSLTPSALLRDVVRPGGIFAAEFANVGEGKESSHFLFGIMRRLRRQPIETTEDVMVVKSSRTAKVRTIMLVPYERPEIS